MDTYLFDKVLSLVGDVDPEMQIQTVRSFLFVAHRGTCNQKEVERALGMTNASASRNISYWTERRFDKKVGKGFIVRVEDPVDRRFKILTLTKKGRAFLDKIKEA